MPRGEQAGDVGHRSAAHEQASGGFRKSAPPAEPADYLQLKCGSGRAPEPGAIENVEPGGKRVGHGADEIVRPGDEGEKARMIDVKIVWENIALQAREKLMRIGGSIARHAREQRTQGFRIGFCSDRAVAHAREMIRQQIDHTVAEAAHLFGRKFEAGRIVLHLSNCRGGQCNQDAWRDTRRRVPHIWAPIRLRRASARQAARRPPHFDVTFNITG